LELVDEPAPGEGAGDEDAAVGGEDAAVGGEDAAEAWVGWKVATNP
jgi:hypothetical protein